MSRGIHTSTQWRCWSLLATRTHATRRSIHTIPSQRQPDIESLRHKAFLAEKPLHLRCDGDMLPATSQWFTPIALESTAPRTLTTHFTEQSHHKLDFPFEVYVPQIGSNHSTKAFQRWLLSHGADGFDQHRLGLMMQAVVPDNPDSCFYQLHAPISLLQHALEFNSSVQKDPVQLYIAQCAISELPGPLQQDVQAPELVLKVGKGDIYASSIWIGTEPTYTPMHRDPNPNLFYQLCGRKNVRLLPPGAGDLVFVQAQRKLGRQGSSRIRGSQMMEEPERTLLYNTVWEDEEVAGEMYEGTLDEGDGLFIPKGWWHSVRSVGKQGGLNGSVNWWFR
ncbi:putative JmjC domain protein [Emericellopsis atlantica]|uniref:JmjC domain protein n=1 Tax=Emericellopsis atlantica TaxID=2614577 RepID=A0A9P7ZFQ3_9HYPO|nr:putative JmjC domain protein [Emericellopsis atlantica]KAG9251299.1 putative JmjC domain protein [Emericellopsis atlantica]